MGRCFWLSPWLDHILRGSAEIYRYPELLQELVQARDSKFCHLFHPYSNDSLHLFEKWNLPILREYTFAPNISEDLPFLWVIRHYSRIMCQHSHFSFNYHHWVTVMFQEYFFLLETLKSTLMELMYYLDR